MLQAANTYGGNTQVNQGILNIQNSRPWAPPAPRRPCWTGRSSSSRAASNVTGEALRISGTGIFNTGAVESVGGANTWEGNVTLAQDPAFSPATTPPTAVDIGVLYNTVGDSLTFNGAISQVAGAALGLTKVGLGTLVLDNNANTYNGVTTVSAGTLRVQQGGALGTPTNGTVVQSGAALEIDGDPTGIGGGTGITVPGEALTLNGNGAPEVQALTVAGTAGNVHPHLQRPDHQATARCRSTPPPARSRRRSTGSRPSAANGVTVTQVGSTYLIIFTGADLSGANQNLIGAAGSGGATPAVTPVRDGGQGALSNLTGVNDWAGPITLQTNSMIGAAAGTSLLASGVDSGPGHRPRAGPHAHQGRQRHRLLQQRQHLLRHHQRQCRHPQRPEQLRPGRPGQRGPDDHRHRVDHRLVHPAVPELAQGDPVRATRRPPRRPMVRTAINGLLPGLGINGTVSVTQAGNVYTVTFNGGAVAGLNQPQLVAVGSGGTIATVATVRDGSNGTVVANGATLQVQGGITISNEPLTISGAGFGGIGALDSPSGTNTWDGPITLAGAASIGADTDSTPAVSTLTIDQVIGQSVDEEPAHEGRHRRRAARRHRQQHLHRPDHGGQRDARAGQDGRRIAVPAGLTVGTGTLPPGSAVAQLEGNNQIANGAGADRQQRRRLRPQRQHAERRLADHDRRHRRPDRGHGHDCSR